MTSADRHSVIMSNESISKVRVWWAGGLEGGGAITFLCVVSQAANQSCRASWDKSVIQCEAKTLWTQLDVIDAGAAKRAELNGVRVVMDRCPAIEWPRLQAAGLL